jgi:hypothetical protein
MEVHRWSIGRHRRFCKLRRNEPNELAKGSGYRERHLTILPLALNLILEKHYLIEHVTQR